jgi:hypothetical protein
LRPLRQTLELKFGGKYGYLRENTERKQPTLTQWTCKNEQIAAKYAITEDI